MTRSTRCSTGSYRSFIRLISCSVAALFIGALPGCDRLPEVIGLGDFDGLSANPEDDLGKGEGQQVVTDLGVIPQDAPFAADPGQAQEPWHWDPGTDIPGYATRDIVEEAFPGEKGMLTTVMLGDEYSSEPIEVDVEVFDGKVVLGGDILLGHIEDFQGPPGSRAAGMARTVRRWTGGVVPFEPPTAMSTVMQGRIATAISDWMTDTGLTFVTRTTETNYISFLPVAKGCSSLIGRHVGRQFINLSEACSTGNVRHEIGHAIGLFHEHTRQDRNDFVSVDLLATTSPHNYWRYSASGFVGVDLGPYDLGSLMHYGSFFFASNSSVPVMLTTGGGVITAQRAALTTGDLWGVDRMYFDTWQVSWSGTSIWNTLNYSGLDPSQLLFGDFDGDGQDDVFWANGSEWKISWSGTSAWDTVNTSGYTNVKIGDMNGDGRDDVFLATGNAWYVSWEGSSSWELINNSTMTNVLLGDMNGDGTDDVLYADGFRWWLSNRGTSPWYQINSSTFTDLQIGDLDGDGADDVFRAGGGRWYVSWSGTTSWDNINNSSYEDVSLADFDGDGIDDVFVATGSRWLVSSSGTSAWNQINSSGYTNLGIADFDGDGEADIMVQMGPYGI